MFVRRIGVLIGITALVAGVTWCVPVSATPPRVTATVAGAFTDSLVTAAIGVPTAVTALPGGGAVVLDKGGDVRIVRNGTLLASPALSLSVCTESERGLLGFAVDPAFGSNGFVYVYFTRSSPSAPGGCVNRVSRFTMHGDVIAPSSQRVLLDNIGSPGGNHNGGDLFVGNDGYLYVSVGDGGCNVRALSDCAGNNQAAQDRSLLNGKVLRVDRSTGAPAAGNPFTGAGSAVCRIRGNTASTPSTRCREIYAFGLRNPWRFAFDPNTSATRFFINDVGQDTREEVDLGVVGSNYGWPVREGVCPQGHNPPCAAAPSVYRQPLTDYPHNATVGGEYITGGAFVPNGAWPSSFDGGYLFADGNPGKIFFRNAAGTVNYSAPFAAGVSSISDLGFVMDPGGWSLYYVLPGAGQVRKITYRAPAASPVGNLVYSPLATASRVLDTRHLGAASGPVRAGASRLVRLVAAVGAHRAALVNITMVAPSSDGDVSAWRPRSARPATGNVVGQRGLVSAAASVVPIDSNGNVELFTSATSNLIVDLVGFFDVSTGPVRAGRYVPVGPVAAIDTRMLPSLANAYVRTSSAGVDTVNMPVRGLYGIPVDAAEVALQVTGSADSGPNGGTVVAMPHGGTVPPTSNLNTNGNGDMRTNLVVVPIGADGSVDLRLRGTADVVVGVVGWFTGASSAVGTAGRFVLLPPVRVVNTRTGVGFHRLAARAAGAVNPAVVPDTALAIAATLAMASPGGAGSLTVYPNGLSPVPSVATVMTVLAGQSRGGADLSAMTSGVVRCRTTVATDVVVDVMGYFAG
ncbi:MAG: PQQ-dependent sugar dehydrogenase [Actinomycetota bacterium]